MGATGSAEVQGEQGQESPVTAGQQAAQAPGSPVPSAAPTSAAAAPAAAAPAAAAAAAPVAVAPAASVLDHSPAPAAAAEPSPKAASPGLVPKTVGVQSKDSENPQAASPTEGEQPKKTRSRKQKGEGSQPPEVPTKGAGKGKGKGKEFSDPTGANAQRRPTQGVQLCVRNLTREFTVEQLRALFEPFGTLLSAQVKKNPEGQCKGFGFVTYNSMEEAQLAIKRMNNYDLETKKLLVVLSDHQQGLQKEVRQQQEAATKGGKAGKGAVKGKGKGADAEPAYPTATGSGYQTDPAAYAAAYAAYAAAAYGGQGTPQQTAYQQYVQSWYYQQLLQGYYGGVPPQGAPTVTQLNLTSPAPGPPPLTEGKGGKAKGKTKGQAKPVVESSTLTASAPEFVPQKPKVNKEKVDPSKIAEWTDIVQGKRYEGTTKSLSTEKGFGFIKSDVIFALCSRDVYVKLEQLPAGTNIATRVSFAITFSAKGHPCAEDVQLVT